MLIADDAVKVSASYANPSVWDRLNTGLSFLSLPSAACVRFSALALSSTGEKTNSSLLEAVTLPAAMATNSVIRCAGLGIERRVLFDPFSAVYLAARAFVSITAPDDESSVVFDSVIKRRLS